MVIESGGEFWRREGKGITRSLGFLLQQIYSKLCLSSPPLLIYFSNLQLMWRGSNGNSKIISFSFILDTHVLAYVSLINVTYNLYFTSTMSFLSLYGLLHSKCIIKPIFYQYFYLHIDIIG